METIYDSDDYSLNDQIYDMDFIDFSVDIIKTFDNIELNESMWDNVKTNLMTKVNHFEKNVIEKKRVDKNHD